MNNSILDDFKYAWNKPDNAPAQLIIINVAVFLILGILMVVSDLSNSNLFHVVYEQFRIPPTLGEFLTRPWTLLTYAFAHDMPSILHILFNMLVFYWFSRLIQEFVGNDRVVALYILGALAGGLAYLMVYNLIPFYREMAPSVTGMVGASAAVYAIVVAAAVFMPNYTFFLLFLGPVKIKYIAAFYVVLSFLQSTGGNAGGNIAHLGGALIGWVYVLQLKRGTDLGKWIISICTWVKGLFSPSSKIRVTHRNTATRAQKRTMAKAKKQSAHMERSEQEEIDDILDKISQSGYDSLSKEEKQKLFEASKK